MPNIGHPSRACHLCRQRRVKCDLARPGCRRCERRGHACPGYRDEMELRFRTESVASYQSSTGRPRKRNKASVDESSAPPGDTELQPKRPQQRLLRWTHPRVAPVSPPRVQWEEHLLPLVVDQFSYGQARSIYGFIPQFISRAAEQSALQLAGKAVSAAHLLHSDSSTTPPLDSIHIYTKAIMAMNSTLADPEKRKGDDILLGIWLMGLYEYLWDPDLSGHSDGGPSGYDAHGRGMLELIRLRGAEQFASADGRNLFWMVYNTIVQQILTGQDNDPDTLSWIQDVAKKSTPPEFLILRTAIFTYHCIRICSHIKQLLQQGRSDDDLLLSYSPCILKDVDEIEVMIDPFPSDSPITSHTINPPQEPYTIPAHMDLLYIGVHTYQCFFRMQLAWRVVEFLQRASTAPGCSPQQRTLFEGIQARSIEDLRALANKVLSMLARSFRIDSLSRLDHLGRSWKSPLLVRWSDAIRILPPVRTIAACPFVLVWQRDAANKALTFIKKELGVAGRLATSGEETRQ